jgi:hypothetical protein
MDYDTARSRGRRSRCQHTSEPGNTYFVTLHPFDTRASLADAIGETELRAAFAP